MVYSREEKFIKKVGENIRQLREEKGMTQAELAFNAGVEYSQVSRIERGVINTSLTQLNKIAIALSVHPKELL